MGSYLITDVNGPWWITRQLAFTQLQHQDTDPVPHDQRAARKRGEKTIVQWYGCGPSQNFKSKDLEVDADLDPDIVLKVLVVVTDNVTGREVLACTSVSEVQIADPVNTYRQRRASPVETQLD